ncbi:dienelactone hydrolase family protein [Williamwhitmania taraxaci]|uniref:Dienelactone hydrolase family protein n=1 Tax=Williamwhitmania taraxaci TaxID=1640674 RepID=A0A1G6NBZ4_9BACT|nr:dienelactone hydrolase family protein [Williamwhitmania taraxaci]SDC65221.1 Dienelactone hydrolase family protein [Williamwhitmania taraxaci]
MKFVIIILTMMPFLTFGQYDPKMEEYQHKRIITKSDTINYQIYSKGNIKEKNKILIYFQGSGPTPLFRETTKSDTIKVVENGITKDIIEKSIIINSFVPFDLDSFPNDYIFVIISKKGVPFSADRDTYKPSQTFLENESLNYRVWQGDEVINDLTKYYIKNPNKVVIIGHSEGSDVVAKLGHTNKKITHIGFWAGGGNTQYYDFALFIQKDVQSGKITQTEAVDSLEGLFNDIKNIESDPDNTEKQWLGNSYRRWAHFSEPAIDNLLKINKPLFVAVAGKDESVPIESSLLIPIEFIRHKKTNLTFKIYPDYDHSFAIPMQDEDDEDEDWIWEWKKVFEDFMKWVEQ